LTELILFTDGAAMAIKVKTMEVSRPLAGITGNRREYVGIFSSVEEVATLAWVRLNAEKIGRVYFCYQHPRRFRAPRLHAVIRVQFEKGIPRLIRQVEPANTWARFLPWRRWRPWPEYG
jgi:hypothetical protein